MIVSQTQRQLHEAHLARRARFFKPAPRLRLVPKVAPPPTADSVPTLKTRTILPGNPNFIGPVRPINEGPQPKIKIILRSIADAYGVKVSELIGPRRTARISEVRHIGFWLARHVGKYSQPEIGRRFGGRDHTSVLHGVRRIESRIERDSDFAVEMRTLRSLIAAQIGAVTL